MITEGYFLLIDKYSDNDELVLVSSTVPSFVKEKMNDSGGRMCHSPYLAPEHSTILQYKRGLITWNRFEAIYRRRIKGNRVAQLDIEWLLKDSNDGMVLRLLCWEKAEDKRCHRFTLLDILRERGAHIG